MGSACPPCSDAVVVAHASSDVRSSAGRTRPAPNLSPVMPTPPSFETRVVVWKRGCVYELLTMPAAAVSSTQFPSRTSELYLFLATQDVASAGARAVARRAPLHALHGGVCVEA